MSSDPRALLVLGGPRLARGPLLESVERLGNAGWRVDLVCWRGLDDELRETVTLTGGEIVLPVAVTRRRRLPRRLGTLVDRATRRVPPSVAFARLAGRDLDGRRLAQECDVAVAVDRDAALTVWLLARRRPDVTAVSGLAALSRVL